MTDSSGPPPLAGHRPSSFSGGVYWFDGILEGPATDRSALRAELPRLGALGLAVTDVELEGGRFSILADDRRRPIDSASGLDHEELRDALQALVRLAANPAACESTLRLTELGPERARETLFAVREGEVQRVSRERPLRPEDMTQARRPPEGEIDPALAKRRRFLVAAALALAGIVVIWQSGILGGFLAPGAEELAIDRGPFGDLVAVEIEDQFLAYRVLLRRGPAFPESPRAAREAREATSDLLRAAAIKTVADGGMIYLELVDEKGAVVGGVGQSLLPLLQGEEVFVTGVIPARVGARRLRLASSPHSGHKGM